MKKYFTISGFITATTLLLAVGNYHAQGIPAEPGKPPREIKHGIAQRIPWTTSRIIGSPEPPDPYRIERAFPKLTFKNPLLMTMAPGTNRFFVGEQFGKLFSFRNEQSCAKADLFFDLTTELHSWDPAGKVKGVGAVYGLTFHPQFARNRFCYICYVLDSKTQGEQLRDGSRISRFRVTDTDPPRCDPKSEKVLLTWLAGGHNGCDLHFGPDGYLYISTGDGANPNPPDVLDTGQDISDLLSSILRIDVDHEDAGKTYAIPKDNPFVATPGARPEVWAYGLRNPWRMSFDRATGDLWVGDVGWELWEMIYRVKRGGNYGWPIMEGPQSVRPDSKKGPTPILPPNLSFPHTEAASITGGYVYRGKLLKNLVGVYLCGDWVTRRLWGTRFDGDRVVWHKLLAQGDQRIVAFGQAEDGEIFIVAHDEKGSIHRIVPNDTAQTYRNNFPTKLSETGLFASVQEHTPAPGVVPFSLNAAQWADHATAERFVALPGTATVRMYDQPIPAGGFYTSQTFFPKDGVLAKTFSLEMEPGKHSSRRRLETQILHYDGTVWKGYTYQWNDEQTDAVLVPATGAERIFSVADSKAPGGRRQQKWHFASRAECLQCHNAMAGPVLGFTRPQLNRNHDYGAAVDNQLRAFEHVGIITHVTADTNLPEATPPLADPHDAKASLLDRARAYLHVNCSHCHQAGAGGTADIDLRFTLPLDQTKIVEARPVQGSFDIPNAHIVSPADPYRSILYYRMAKLGAGRMPHIGSDLVDQRGLKLIHDWIQNLPTRGEERALLQKLHLAGPTAALDAKQTEALQKLLSTTTGALLLAHAMGENNVPASVHPQILAAVKTVPAPQIRDLFERFLPDDQRIRRLGTVVRP